MTPPVDPPLVDCKVECLDSEGLANLKRHLEGEVASVQSNLCSLQDRVAAFRTSAPDTSPIVAFLTQDLATKRARLASLVEQNGQLEPVTTEPYLDQPVQEH